MRLWSSLLALGAALCLTGGVQAHANKPDQTPDQVKIVTVKVEGRLEVQRLVNLGFDIAGVNVQAGTVDLVVVPKRQGPLLEGMPELEIQRTKWLDTRLAPDSEYKTPAEIDEILHGYAVDFPHLASVESIGQSLEGRNIWALKITDHPGERELDEPAILFNGMHHAREVMTPEIPLDMIEFLLTGYGSDAEATRWVEESEIWVVPMINPDGNNKVWTEYSMWRKNTRGGYGVDINRNYPYAWGSCRGSSGSRWSAAYRGPSPASEPETQAFMAFVARTEPVFNISYHSYSELVLYPYGCDGQRTVNVDVIEGIGQEMAALLPSDTGRGTYTPGTPWDVLYAVDGDDISWMHHEYHVIPYVIEVNSSRQGFQPAYSWRQPTVEKLRPAWKLLFDRLFGPGIRGKVVDGSGRALPDTRVKVEALGETPLADFTWKIKGDGTYHIVLEPGMYLLTFNSGGRTVEREVTIGADRVEMDVEL